MAEKPDKNSVEIAKAAKAEQKQAEAAERGATATEKALDQAKKDAALKAKKDEVLTKIAQEQLEINKIRAAGDTENADRLQKALDKTARYAANTNADSIDKLDNRLEELNIISDDTSDTLKRQEDKDKAFLDNQKSGILSIADRIKEQTEAEEASDGMVEKALGKLDGFGMGANENSKLLREEFARAQELEKSGRAEDIKAAQEIKAAVISAAADEEKRREAEELAKEQSNKLTQIANGFNNFADKYGDTAKSAVKTAGFLGVIAALIFGAVDPDKLMKLVDDIVKGFLEIVEGFMALISGDTDRANELLGKNWKLLLGVITGVALWFAGPIIKIFGSMFTMLNKVMKVVKFFRITAIAGFVKNMIVSLATMAKDLALGALKKVVAAAKAFRVFSLTTMVPALLSTFSAIVAAMLPVIAAVWPVVAIIGVIAAAFMLIKNYLGEGASITDTLKYAMLLLLDGLGHIVNAFTFIPRKIFGFFGERIGKFLLGDDFEMPDFITKGMKTNRASEFKAELDSRVPDTTEIDGEIKDVAEQGVEGSPYDISELEGMQDENLEGQLDLQGAGGGQILAAQNNVTASNSSSSQMIVNHTPPSSAAIKLAAYSAYAN